MISKGRELAEIAADQWGLVTAAQARRVGITAQNMSQMAKAGDLVRLAHGIYRLAGNPIDRHEDLRAAWLALDPSRTAADRITEQDVDIVSHRSAALVLEIGDLAADVMEFTAPQRRQTRRTDVRLHRGATHGDWALADGLPVATPLRIIADLAAAGIDRGHLATVVRDAMIKYDLPADAVAGVLARHARRYGGATGNGSGLLTVLLREAGVPRSTVDIAARGIPQTTMTDFLRATGHQTIDPNVLSTVMPKLDPNLLAAIMPRLDPNLLAAIMPKLDPNVLAAIMPKLDLEVWRAFQRDIARAVMPGVAQAIQDLSIAALQGRAPSQAPAALSADAQRQGAVDEDEQRAPAAIEAEASGDNDIRRGERG